MSPIKFGENGLLISQNLSHTNLGLCFQRDATWTFHVQLIHEKATVKLRGKHYSRFILHSLDLLWKIQMLSGTVALKKTLNC